MMATNGTINNRSTRMLLLFSIISLSLGLCQADNITIEQGGSIQAAIDKARPGDIIEIKSGTYKESINISKRLAIYGIDSGNGKPIILNEDDHNKSAVILSANGCTIQGIIIKSVRICALTILSDLNTVNGNTIIGRSTGVYLKKSCSNFINHNNISIEGNPRHGLLIMRSVNNTIKGNNISFNGISSDGIDLVHSYRNTISDNTIKGNGWIGGAGISSLYSDTNSMNDNTIKTRGFWGSGIYIMGSANNTLDNNEVEHHDFSGSGITLCSSSRNHVIYNTAEGNGQLNCAGIFLRHSNGNYITDNKVSSTGNYGSSMSLLYSDDNKLTSNEAHHSTHGIYLYSSKSNTIEHNTAKYNSDYDIYIDFFSPYNSIKYNIGNLYVVEPHWSHIENNVGQIKEFTVDYPDQVPVFTLSDLVDLTFLIWQFILGFWQVILGRFYP